MLNPLKEAHQGIIALNPLDIINRLIGNYIEKNCPIDYDHLEEVIGQSALELFNQTET
jgi:hypothetical protein